MDKILEIKIDNKGHQRGTVGWLLNVADHIKIGESTSGEQGAWLKDKQDKTICPLVIRNWYDNGQLAIVEQLNSDDPGYTLMLDFYTSKACMQKIQELAKEVTGILDEIFEADDKDDCSLRIEVK